MLAFGYIKISFKPITSKTETWTVLQHYALKNKNPKPKKNPKTNNAPPTPKKQPIYPNVGKNPPNTDFLIFESLYLDRN